MTEPSPDQPPHPPAMPSGDVSGGAWPTNPAPSPDIASGTLDVGPESAGATPQIVRADPGDVRVGHGSGRPAGKQSRASRYPMIFAVVGVVLALAAGGFYLYPALTQGAGEAPDAAVRRFLAQLSLPGDRVPGTDVTCSTWDPTGAVIEMARQVGPDMDVSWDNIVVLRQTDEEATVLARLSYYRYGQSRPSGQRQWRFSVVDEDGWRVCGASPLVP